MENIILIALGVFAVCFITGGACYSSRIRTPKWIVILGILAAAVSAALIIALFLEWICEISITYYGNPEI